MHNISPDLDRPKPRRRRGIRPSVIPVRDSLVDAVIGPEPSLLPASDNLYGAGSASLLRISRPGCSTRVEAPERRASSLAPNSASQPAGEHVGQAKLQGHESRAGGRQPGGRCARRPSRPPMYAGAPHAGGVLRSAAESEPDSATTPAGPEASSGHRSRDPSWRLSSGCAPRGSRTVPQSRRPAPPSIMSTSRFARCEWTRTGHGSRYRGRRRRSWSGKLARLATTRHRAAGSHRGPAGSGRAGRCAYRARRARSLRSRRTSAQSAERTRMHVSTSLTRR